MLAVISPWNGTVFWLDPAGAENDILDFAQMIINDGIKSFSLKYRMDIKKLKKIQKLSGIDQSVLVNPKIPRIVDTIFVGTCLRL